MPAPRVLPAAERLKVPSGARRLELPRVTPLLDELLRLLGVLYDELLRLLDELLRLLDELLRLLDELNDDPRLLLDELRLLLNEPPLLRLEPMELLWPPPLRLPPLRCAIAGVALSANATIIRAINFGVFIVLSFLYC